MASPSDRQLEKHIKLSAVDSAHVVFTDHARLRMRQRYINDPMVLDVLRNGIMAPKPESDMKHTGLNAGCNAMLQVFKLQWLCMSSTQLQIWLL